MKSNIKKIVLLAAVLVLLGGLSSFVDAQTNNGQQSGNQPPQGRMNGQGAPVLVGKVTAISGTSITVTGKAGMNKDSTETTYTVDASKATFKKNNTTITVSDIAVGDTIVVSGTISGTTVTATSIIDGQMQNLKNDDAGRPEDGRKGNGVMGTVTAVSGTTITMTSKEGNSSTETTYTVDASKAIVTKNGETSSVSVILANDKIMVEGTVSGTTITAEKIHLGLGDQLDIEGSGEPIVAGKITAISGNTITISNKASTYAIDASSAKFVVKGVTSATISNISVGDSVVVQGAINGTSVTASSVINEKTASSSTTSKVGGFFGGMMGGITNFFRRLFGF